MSNRKAFRKTLFVALIYFVLGNITGYGISKGIVEVDGILYYLFLPYTFTWGLASMVGFDLLAFVFLLIAFGITCVLFLPIGLYFADRST